MLSPLRRALPTALLLALTAACGGGTAVPGAPPLAPVGLSYPTLTPVAVTGEAFSLTPAIQGELLTWSITPTLPPGLGLDPETGVLGGVPSAKSPLTAYTIRAENETGSDTTFLQMVVNDPGAPTNLSYPQTFYDFGVGSAVGPVTPTVTGTVQIFSTVPSLPPGLVLDGATGAISGTPILPSGTVDHVVLATNTDGSALTLVRIKVSATGPPQSIDYTDNPAVYVQGQPIPPNTPLVDGFASKYELVVFPVDPPHFYSPLPQGLSFNVNTGIISGTPQVETDGAQLHLIRATNSFPGNATVELTITVLGQDSPPQSVTYSQNPALYTVGETITPNTPTAVGDVNFWSVDTTTDPPLPIGLTLDPLTGVISGTPTQSKAFGPHTIKADNAFGSTTAKLFLEVDAARSHLLMTVNTGDATLSSLTLSSSDGRARHAGYGVTNTAPVDAVLAHDARFAYVANLGSASITSFPVDPLTGRTGTPTDVPISAGTQPQALALSPDGEFLYVALGGNNLIVPFSVDTQTGGLSEGVPVLSGTGVNALVVAPSGGVLCATNSGVNAVQTFTLDTATGVPTVADSASTGSGPTGLIVAPDSSSVYVANNTSGTVSQYALSPAGLLTPLSPSSVSSGVQTQSLAVSPSGDFLFAANTSGSISQYRVNGNGTLSPLGTPSLAVTAGVWDLGIDAEGELLYATNVVEGELSTFTIAGSGQLALLELVRTRPQPIALTVGPGQSAVTLTSTNAFVVNEEDGDVTSLALDSLSGQVTALSLVDPIVGATPTAIAVSADNQFAFVAGTGTNSLYTLDVNLTTGALTSSQAPLFLGNGTSPAGVAVGPNGRHAYSVNISADDVVSLDIDPQSGALTLGTSAATGSLPRNGTIEPTGRFLYTANSFSVANDDVSILGLNASTGGVSNQGAAGFPSMASVWEVVVHPTGRFAYATNSLLPGTVAQFEIDAATGALAPLTPAVLDVGGTLKSAAIDSKGAFLFVAGVHSTAPKGRVHGFTIDATTGRLTSATWGSAAVGDDPIDIGIEGSGRHLLVLSRGFRTLQSFAIDSTTGALSFTNQAGVGNKPRGFDVTRLFQ